MDHGPQPAVALDVMRAWGFQYKSCAAWDKGTFGMGHYWRIQHELLLLGRRGREMSAVHNLRSAIREKRTKHSAKPQTAYEHIEAMFPDRRKIELFARIRRGGWTSWGNEVSEPPPCELLDFHARLTVLADAAREAEN